MAHCQTCKVSEYDTCSLTYGCPCCGDTMQAVATADYSGDSHAEKCKHCHLFIEPNEYDPEYPDLARYIHLTRGDDADEEIDGDHNAEPSGEIHTIDWWLDNGPTMMRLRFIRNGHQLTVTPGDDIGWSAPEEGEPDLNPVDGWCDCGWGYSCPDPDALLDAFLDHVR
jgi:hypothetical protein